MRSLRFLLSLSATLLLCYVLSRPWGAVTFRPAAFLSPFEGFWKNAGEADLPALSSSQLKGEVKVVVDEDRVPHIFAQNRKDAAFVQGFMTAKDRLWQMEFQTHAAAGRLTEIIGRGENDVVLNLDKTARKKGMPWAAQRAVDTMKQNTEVWELLTAYSNGINAYIASLSDKDLPLEYKLLNYRPESWSPYKTALLLKYMANVLTSRSEDIEYTHASKIWNAETLKLLYPERPFPQSPIIPEGTKWDFSNTENSAASPILPKKKSIKYAPQPVLGVSQSGTPHTNGITAEEILPKPEKGIGSNNWAVSGTKTASGSPILCNDPHLMLSLPSIWYELHVQTPESNVYGVSLPGAPGIIIGFNDSISWGVTNGGVDVWDYYRITFKDKSRNEYKYGSQWLKTDKKVETYRLKGGETLTDTTYFTALGPILYDNESDGALALKWMAHAPSLEAMTFLKLNVAKNYSDYEAAIATYQCPAQNFVFASRTGDIAIWQQGKFVNRLPNQGRGILEGSDSTQSWRFYVPQKHNPHILNPERGYVGSANQAPTDGLYPYYVSSIEFESFRNRRMNQRLDSLNQISIQDMQALQLDNYGMYAHDILPTMLSIMDSARINRTETQAALAILKKWDYMYDKSAVAPAIFEAWWFYLMNNIWNDEYSQHKVALALPDRSASIVLLRDSTTFAFYDNVNTPEKETRAQLVIQAFQSALDSMQRLNPTLTACTWGKAKRTNITHLTRILKAFGLYDIETSGNVGILNATGKVWGPSWRMVVSMGKEIEAYGIYPGGQSGNPGSPFYDNFVDEWVEGKYRKLNPAKSPLQVKGKVYTFHTS